MKTVKLTIDFTSPEGKQIVEELKQFPDIVFFGNELSEMEEPVKAYDISPKKTLKKDIPDKYMESDLFWELVEQKRETFWRKSSSISS